MTRQWILCVLLLLAGIVHAIDIDFESYTTGIAPPAPWTSDTGVTVSSAVAHSGDKALQIFYNSYDLAQYPFSVKPNETASFSVWVRPGSAEQNWQLAGITVLPTNASRSRSLVFNRNWHWQSGSTLHSIQWYEFGAGQHSAGDFTPESWYQVNCEISLSNITLSATTESGELSYSFDRNGEEISSIELAYCGGGETDPRVAYYDDLSITLPPPPATTNTLTVVSEYGNPDPAVGMNPMPYGTTGTCTVEQVTFDLINYSPTGWTMTGNEPFSGTTNWFVGTLTNDAVLTWNWQTNYWIDIQFDGNGSVDLDSGFQAKDSEQVLTATPDEGWLFTGWNGAAYGTGEAIVLMTEPQSITAHFSTDPDEDGLTNTEEAAAGSNPWKADTDDDGFDDAFEVAQGLSPTNDNSAIVNYIADNDAAFGLYPSNVVLDVAVGQMVLDVVGSEATLSLQLEESDDLVTWTNAGPPEVWNWTVDGEKKFFRVRSAK